RITRAMDKLQRLHDELDVANAAASKFYVALQLFRPNYVALDAVLDVRNLLEQIRRCTFRVDEWLMQPQEIVSQLAAAGDSARLDERNPLPRFAEPRVIVFHALERPSQRACRAFGAQPQIRSKQRAGRMRLRECFENLVSQSIEKLMVRNVGRELAFFAVEKKKIDV